jgi:hypothetical protein
MAAEVTFFHLFVKALEPNPVVVQYGILLHYIVGTN